MTHKKWPAAMTIGKLAITLTAAFFCQQESLTTEKKEAELSKQTAVEKISELQAHRLVGVGLNLSSCVYILNKPFDLGASIIV